MANEYINRNRLLQHLTDWWLTESPSGNEILFINGKLQTTPVMKIIEKCMKVVEEQPTADVVEMVQSLWKKTANEKPNSTRHLIVANSSLISHYGYYLKPKDKWYKTFKCEEEIEVPAFWMDMPKPPKESIYDECAVIDGKKVE